MIKNIKPPHSGTYFLNWSYSNHANSVREGITNGAKWMGFYSADGKPLWEGVMAMPHTPKHFIPQKRFFPSAATPPLYFEGGKSYEVRLSDFFNMSYLKKNETYLLKGGKRIYNLVDLRALEFHPSFTQY